MTEDEEEKLFEAASDLFEAAECHCQVVLGESPNEILGDGYDTAIEKIEAVSKYLKDTQ